jgi:hypothetical protein
MTPLREQIIHFECDLELTSTNILFETGRKVKFQSDSSWKFVSRLTPQMNGNTGIILEEINTRTRQIIPLEMLGMFLLVNSSKVIMMTPDEAKKAPRTATLNV